MSNFAKIAFRSLLLALALAALAGAGPALAYERPPLSDAEYQWLLKHSPDFAAADKDLSRAWKALPSDIREELGPEQRDWIRTGRDRDARHFMRQGEDTATAYAKATDQRTRVLREYKSGGSHHKDHGDHRGDDGDYRGHDDRDDRDGHRGLNGPLTDENYKKLVRVSPDFAEADREMGRVWKKLPDRAQKKLLPEQRAWTQTTRDREAHQLIRDGVGYAEAYTRVTRHRTRVLHDYLTGKLDF